MSDFHAVICGGGVASAEALLRLRRLAGDSLRTTLIAPNDELIYRPLAVEEPFAKPGIRRYPLEKLVKDTGAEWVRDALDHVDLEARSVSSAGGQHVEFDALLLAVGARLSKPFPYSDVFTDAQADDAMHGLLQDIEGGYTRSVAFIQPEGPAWPLPLYELALMTSERARSMGQEVDISLVIPDRSPLAPFGQAATRTVALLLQESGIRVFPNARPAVPAPRAVIVRPGGDVLTPERIVSLPCINGPAIRGVAGSDEGGFVRIESTCAFPGSDGRVFAAGDCAAFPIKHGGLAAQMADTAATNIARLAGVPGELGVLQPVIRGKLLTGQRPMYLTARIVGGRGFHSDIFHEPPWPTDEKIVAAELAPYLSALDRVA